jgi:hypothetical protein
LAVVVFGFGLGPATGNLDPDEDWADLADREAEAMLQRRWPGDEEFPGSVVVKLRRAANRRARLRTLPLWRWFRSGLDRLRSVMAAWS